MYKYIHIYRRKREREITLYRTMKENRHAGYVQEAKKMQIAFYSYISHTYALHTHTHTHHSR